VIVRCVDIGAIVDFRYLNFLFIAKIYLKVIRNVFVGSCHCLRVKSLHKLGITISLSIIRPILVQSTAY